MDSKVTIFTLAKDVIFEKTLKDGRKVTVYPAYENARVFKTVLDENVARESYQKLQPVKGGGFCLPFGQKAIGLTAEEVRIFNTNREVYLKQLTAKSKAQMDTRRSAFDYVHPQLNWAIDQYGTYENANKKEDTFAADLLFQLESGNFDQKIKEFYSK